MDADLLTQLATGLNAALAPTTLFYCFVGVLIGTLVGVLPGIGSMAALSLLLPLTYVLPPTAAIVMMAGVYYGAQYGGSTASILLNLPGTPSAAVACIDGYPMARAGRAGVALFITTVASFVGAMIGLVVLVAFSPAIAELGFRFGPTEYFAMMMLGLMAASTLGLGSPLKGLAMVVLGLLLGMVGTDVQSGMPRFDFDIVELTDGIHMVVLAMGVFGVAEVIGSLDKSRGSLVTGHITLRSMLPRRDDMKRSAAPMLRGSAVGSFFGALPGTGPAIAAFMSYAIEKKLAREPQRFGQGAVEGVAAPEAANNAAVQTAFVPTLTLGIPGDAVMALMIGAMIIHGITPGPLLMTQQPDLFWGLVVSFLIGNLMLVVLNFPLIGLWVSLLRIPYRVLYPAILVFVGLGVYSVNYNPFDVVLVALIGGVGYGMVLLRFHPAPLLLGFILGPLMEEHLRRAMLISHGDPMVFLERPISAGLLAATGLVLAWGVGRVLWRAYRARSAPVRQTLDGSGGS